MNRPSKDEYYLGVAIAISKRSNCIRRQVGAIVVVQDMIVSTGYNGTARGHKNCFDGGCARCNTPVDKIPSGQKLDECLCIHAETNCIMMAANRGISLATGTLYTLLSPCLPCSKILLGCGILKVVYHEDYPINGLDYLIQEIEVVHQGLFT